MIIGIDPGLSGGVAFFNHERMETFVMPTKKISKGKNTIDAGELQRLIGRIAVRLVKIQLVVVEKVHAMPKQGVTSMFTFGVGYGKVLGLIEALGLPLEEPTPQEWKKVVLAGTAKDKEAAVAWCMRRYPKLNLLKSGRCREPHVGMADAVCLAEYGRRLLLGCKQTARKQRHDSNYDIALSSV